jgi:hypothetical protein
MKIMVIDLIRNKPKVGEQEGMRLTIFGDIESIKNLKNAKEVKYLYIINIKQLEFDYLIENYNSVFEFIYLYNMRVADLSKLSMLENIKFLALEWNTKANRLWNIEMNSSLSELYISNFPKLNNLDDLRNAKSITRLELSGGIWNPLKVESLEPLSNLNQLKTLSLLNIKVLNRGLMPISVLTDLEELELPNLFPTKEYALLSMKLKNTKCAYFAPYIKLTQEIDGKDIMVIGKGKPFLNSISDEVKLKKYTQDFECMKKEFE